ncbi:MAG: hypothetical protein ABI211_11540 [Vicinamibacterales bacterium]
MPHILAPGFGRRALLTACLIMPAAIASAQTANVWPLPLPRLEQRATAGGASVEMTIKWNVTAGAPNADPQPVDVAGPPRNDFEVTTRRLVAGALVRQRDPQLSEDDLVIVAVSPQGTDLGWQVIKDPSFVRAETSTPAGELQHQTLRRSEASFIVTLPEQGAGITELRLLKPRWTGTAFVLDPLGSVALPAAGR